jgi:hypothetical protein
MKVLVFVKATPDSEAGIFPADSDKLFAAMGRFNEELVKAGIMKEADGLKPSSAGKRVKFSDDGTTTVLDGPFAETKELVAGYWIWDVKSMDEAIAWARKCPNPMPGDEGVLELRPTYAMEDFVDIAPPAEFEREKRLRKTVARQQRAKTAPKRKVAKRAAPTRKRPAKRAKSKK